MLAARGIEYVESGQAVGVGAGARILHDAGRAEESCRDAGSNFQDTCTGARRNPVTPGREQIGGTAEEGYVYCGPSGAGHFVKNDSQRN